jgi:hypothetical protein
LFCISSSRCRFDFILQLRLADDLVNIVLLVAPRPSAAMCVLEHFDTLRRHRGRGRRPVFDGCQGERRRSNSLRGWQAAAFGPAVVFGEDVKDPIAATAVGLTQSVQAVTLSITEAEDGISLSRRIELPLLV